MSTVYEKVVIEGEGVTLSLLLWRRFKRPTFGLIERILDRQGNLSREFLQRGDIVYIPIDVPETQKRAKVIQLWD